MPDSSGEILRWVLQINTEEVPTADIRVIERAGRTVMQLNRRRRGDRADMVA
jgi:hypothetical protein